MAFTRQPINNTSTFSVNGVTEESISVPTFRRWENTTKETKWELGRGWLLNVPNDQSKIVFNYNGADVFSIESTGDTGLYSSILSLENYSETSDIPDTYNSSGLLARIDGELYMSTNLVNPN